MDAFEREKLIQTIAEQVLQQLHSASAPVIAASASQVVDRRLITEQDVKELVASGKRELWIGEKTLLTPAAQDALRAQRVTVRRGNPTTAPTAAGKNARVGLLAADVLPDFRRGIVDSLKAVGCSVHPVEGRLASYAEREQAVSDLARRVIAGELDSAVVLDEKIFCLAIAANRIERVRCTICWDVSSTRLARDGCGANLLFINDRLIGETTIKEMVKTWIRD